MCSKLLRQADHHIYFSLQSELVSVPIISSTVSAHTYLPKLSDSASVMTLYAVSTIEESQLQV